MAVEFALLVSVLLLMTAGALDGARLTRANMNIKAAAQAGADYARTHPSATASTIGTVVAAAYTGVSAAPAPAQVSGCVSNGQIVSSASACANGTSPGVYWRVGAQASFQAIMPWGLVWPSTVSASAVVRIS